MSGVSRDEIASRWPVLYHMAARDSWTSIKKHGLLSTEALVDLFEVEEPVRSEILSRRRPETYEVTHPSYGVATIRDQKPMSDSGLRRALPKSVSPRQWYRLLNRKVFFWLTPTRLSTLLKASAYRADSHTILHIDSAELLARHEKHVTLAPLNSGCTKPFPHPRDRRTFRPLSKYPYEDRRRRGLEPIVELAVDWSVPDIADLVVRVEERRADRVRRVIFRR